jgi:hypothetical protein
MTKVNKTTGQIEPTFSIQGDYIVYPVNKFLVDIFYKNYNNCIRVRISENTKEIVRTWGNVPKDALNQVDIK